MSMPRYRAITGFGLHAKGRPQLRPVTHVAPLSRRRPMKRGTVAAYAFQWLPNCLARPRSSSRTPTCNPEGEGGEAESNCGRAKEDGPACPHQDVPEVQGVARMPVGAVRDEVLGCEQVVRVELEHPPVALSPFGRVPRGGPQDGADARGGIGMPRRLRRLGLGFQPARRVRVESASGATMLTVAWTSVTSVPASSGGVR
jgi:hypothetical protein